MSQPRRDFLRLLAAAGVTLAAPWGRGFAQGEAPPPERFWVFVHAAGGWDPTLLCDPKGRGSADEVDPVNTYATEDIVEHGVHRCAPIPEVSAFFAKHGHRVLTLNGVDVQTNGHDSGSRHVASGRLADG